ncbi:hypothetical protein ACFW04_009487 [Cataglyphis niger]
MTSMCSGRKSPAVMNTDGYFHRPSPYAYQNDYYLTPRSTWSKVSTAKVNNNAWRFSSAMLIISSMLVLIAVLAIAGLALWMAFRTDSKNAIIEFSCSFRIIRGEKYNPMLKLSTSMVFREKERKFKNIFELLFRRSVLGSSYKQTTIEKFEDGGLKLFFRLYLDRKKIPRSIINIEDTIEDIIVKETYSKSSLFKDMKLDLTTVSVKRISKEENEKIGIINQKQEQQKHAMVTKNNLLRPNRTSNLITSSKPKTHTVRPSKVDFNEPDIDFNNIPTIKGTYRATKVNITAYNSTKRTSESIPDIKDTTRKMLSNEQITKKTSNFVQYSSTDKPSTAFTKSMTVILNEEKLNEKREDEKKTSLKITTTQSNLDIFKDFHNPDLEISPWKPIVPVYNTEFKLLSDDDIKEINRTESSTQKIVSLTGDPRDNIRQLDNKISTTPSAILGLSESVNFHDISTIGTDITGFPRDRIVPNLTMSKSDNNEKPDIEVAGQLPSETYNVRLKISSEYNGNDKKASSTKISESLITRNISENILIKDNALFQKRHADSSNSTEKTEEKFDNLISTIEPDNNESHGSEKNSNKSPTRGIGIAEPLSDTEVELEIKNRDSMLTLSKNEKYTLRDRNVDVNSQPVYTSYNTPNLNGGAFRSSLIENLATIKPFRHTIPVDKITPAVNYNDNISLHYSDDLLISNDEIVAGSNVSQDKIVTPLSDSEEIIKVETFVKEHNDAIDQLSNYEQIMSTEANIIQNNERDELSHFNTTENYLDPIRKLVAENSGDKNSISRNSTFIEIDMVQHMPDQSKENTESYANDAVVNNDEIKKVYNDTLKAYVVKSFVTLAPANKNTEIDKSVQSRLKIDSTAEETTPLEQLFGARNYTHERDIMNTKSAVSERFSSHEIQPDSMKFSEKESSRHKNTIIEQIVEIVTSISTRVSTNIKSNPIVSKSIVTNSANPIIRSEKISTSNNKADKLFGVTANTTENVISLIQERPSLSSKNLRTMQTSDKKTSFEENQSLLEKLKQLAEIRTDDDFVQIMRNNTSSNVMLQLQDFNASSVNIDELKKIANVMTGNKTLKNVNLGFTLSRDGVEVFTKVLNKVEDQTHETLTTIRPDFSKTSPNNNYVRTRSNA